jgi:hypothetical protein
MISTRDIDWVVGFLEGEGCFGLAKCHGRRILPNIQVRQVQKWPLERLVNLFGGYLYLYKEKRSRASDIWYWHIRGPLGAGLMMMLYPGLSPRRKEQIRIALTAWRKAPPAKRYRKQRMNQ